MNEEYLRPEQLLFSVTTSVLIGLLMMAATRRPAETQGRYTMVPLNGDVKVEEAKEVSHAQAW